jgi:hypothetical protein
MNTCPICKKDDQVQRVSTIMDSGTSTTTGIGVGGGFGGGVGVGGYAGVNVNLLTQRLSSVPKPGIGIITGFFVAYLLSDMALVASSKGGLADAEISTWVVGLFFTWIPGLIFALPVKFLLQAFLTTSRNQWDENLAYLRSQYYCFRDDAVLYEGTARTPEEFASWCFSRKN